MSYVDGNLIFYYYGENEAPAGAGNGAQIFPDIVNDARSSGQKFEDPNFPADSSSLQGMDLTYSDGTEMTIEWHRPTDIAQALFKTDPVFHGPYSEFAVNQGSLGDCWWLAVLADVALKPECMKTLVPHDNEVVGWDSGAFHFRFWCRGEWIDVAIDDRLACCVGNPGEIQSVVCAKPTEKGGFWAPLLEKAYAKLYGKYHDISGGQGTDAMIDFTGGFPLSFTPDDPHLKSVIKNAHKLDGIVSFSTKEQKDIPEYLMASHDPNNPGPEGVTNTGIVLGHEYSLLDVHDVQDNNDSSQVHTLLKLRNPWGNKTEWNGKFGRNDPNNTWDTVTPNLIDETGKQKDGEFWIEYEDFKTYFNEIDVCLWSGKYRGYKTEKTPGGADLFIKRGYFTAANSGPVDTTDNIQNKIGFYAHLKPTDPKYNLNGETSQLKGQDCPCGINITMIYSNYTNTDGSGIEEYGFYLLWAPGITKPEGSFFDNEQKFSYESIEGNRSNIVQKYFPDGGTVYIVPWLKNPPPTDTSTPFFLRIAIEGDVHHYYPNE